ncbi:MAG TPA: hypothetical protein VFI31_00230 [Pirellulales bacterium]|nr:hypothetical protein [Pirellulales bacterium]
MLQISGQAIDRSYIEHWSQLLGLGDAWQAVVKRLSEKGAS